jgi:hypothetical protein
MPGPAPRTRRPSACAFRGAERDAGDAPQVSGGRRGPPRIARPRVRGRAVLADPAAALDGRHAFPSSTGLDVAGIRQLARDRGIALRPTDVAATWKAGGQDTLSDLRKRHIGYVLQTGGLLPYLTVGENIGLSRRLLGLPADLTVDLAAGQSICFLMPRHFLAALLLTLIASLLGAVLGGVRAARIEPSDGLREV